MLNFFIATKVAQWLGQENCPARPILDNIRERGFLREAQIEAIQTYLFLKIEGGNRPLWELFAEGFFAPRARNPNAQKVSAHQLFADLMELVMVTKR